MALSASLRFCIAESDGLTDNDLAILTNRSLLSIMSLIKQSGPASESCQPVSSAQFSTTFPERVWDLLACFRSVQLAIVLLSLLALATMAGVLIPQEGVVDTLQIKRQFAENYRLFKAMGLFNVYSSYWFLTLEVLFFFNLLFGSFQWLKPAYLAATQRIFYSAKYIQTSPTRLDYSTQHSPTQASALVMQWLKKNRYAVYQEHPPEEQRLYITKGNWSRLGPVVAHLGILLMLISSVYGVFYGFKAQKLATPGETFRIPDSQMFKPNIDTKLWLGSVPDWKVRVNNFKIEYYPEGQTGPQNAVIKQYYADLSVINAQGKETKREVISVNHPLTVDDTVLYQASFSPTGKLQMIIDGKAKTLETNTQFMNRQVSMSDLPNQRSLLVFPFFVQQDPNVTRNHVVIFLRDAHGFVGAKPGQMPPNLKLQEGQSGILSGMHFTYLKPEYATGLQIKKGPEVPWMYLSYLIIMVGTVMCIFTQRQLWATIVSDHAGSRVSIIFKTKKAKLSFMKELQRFQTDLFNQGFEVYQPETAKKHPAEPLTPVLSVKEATS